MPQYSSTCGGHTEGVAGAVADGELPADADLRTDGGAIVFFMQAWNSNCAASGRYRWNVMWQRDQLEATLNAGLRRLAGSAVSPSFSAESSIGTLTGLSVAQRGASGRALALRVEGTNGAWTVQQDWTIRNLLRTPGGDVLASAAFVLDLAAGGDGKLETVTAFGAGWGHGVGMCQWGTRGLAAKGLNYEAILAHYYPGSELGRVT